MGPDELEWGGKCVQSCSDSASVHFTLTRVCRNDIAIVNGVGRVIVQLGRKSTNMESVLERVERQFELASAEYRFKASQLVHQRGKYRA